MLECSNSLSASSASAGVAASSPAQLPADITQPMPDLVHDAQLNLGLRVNGLDGLGKAFEPIHTGNQDILHAVILQLGHHRQPELGTFGLGHPEAQQLFLALGVDA